MLRRDRAAIAGLEAVGRYGHRPSASIRATSRRLTVMRGVRRPRRPENHCHIPRCSRHDNKLSSRTSVRTRRSIEDGASTVTPSGVPEPGSPRPARRSRGDGIRSRADPPARARRLGVACKRDRGDGGDDPSTRTAKRDEEHFHDRLPQDRYALDVPARRCGFVASESPGSA